MVRLAHRPALWPGARPQPAPYRRVAGYVDRILKGARPGDLPVEPRARVELVVCRTTAKALGLAVPTAVLLAAAAAARWSDAATPGAGNVAGAEDIDRGVVIAMERLLRPASNAAEPTSRM
jgi:hypothetical protein